MISDSIVAGRPVRRLLVLVASVALVLAGLAGSVAGWRAVAGDERRDEAVRSAVVTTTAASHLRDALAHQQQSLSALVGLFAASEEVTRAEFATFTDHVLLDGPGHPYSVGFVRRVRDADLVAFADAARADGAPGFTVRPASGLSEHAIVLYNQPGDPLGIVLGSDAAGSPTRRAALARARDTGQPVLTEALVLQEDQDRPAEEQPAAFFLYAPVYAGGTDPGDAGSRRAALTGWISMPFRAGDLLAGLPEDLPARVTLYRRSARGEIPLATIGTGKESRPADRLEVNVHGQRWFMAVQPAAASGAAGVAPEFVLGAGLLASLLLAGLLYSLYTTGRRAQRTARSATRSLTGSEARLRATLAGAPDLILVVDADGTIASASDRARDVLGYEPESLVGRPVEVLLPEALRDAHAGHRDRFLANPQSRSMGQGLDLTARAADGSLVPVEIALSPLPGLGDDAPTQVIVVVRDVTARKRAEADQRLLSAIVASTEDAVLTKDTNGTISSWNRGAERLYGWTAREAVGRHISFVVPEERRGELNRILARVKAGESVHNLETERLRRDGARVPVSLTISPIRDTSGQVVAASSIARDISGPRAAREALETYAADLERSNRDLEEFAYIASHDLSEPLRVVGGYVDLLQDRYGDGSRPLDRDAARYMDTVAAGVDRMRQLIEGLLSFSRLRTDNQHVGQVDLGQVVASALANLETALTEAGAEVAVGTMPVVWGDAAQITQLVQNLVSNAIKFSDADRPPVVRITAGWRDGRHAISVADNGIGIEPEYHDRIFAMFRRLHARDRYEGTGIGLALCRRVVDLHGGELTLTGEPGRGSTFTFTLSGTPDLLSTGTAAARSAP